MARNQINTPNPPLTDYSSFLRSLGIAHKQVDDYHYLIGKPNSIQGWMLHISIPKKELQNSYKSLIPILLTRKVAFKMPKNQEIAEKILSGNLGYAMIGKVIEIYPDSIAKAIEIAMLLIDLTSNISGPFVPTDAWLGAAVYTRYGAFPGTPTIGTDEKKHSMIQDRFGQLIEDTNDIPFKRTKQHPWPFGQIREPIVCERGKTLANRYMVNEEIGFKPKGGVLKALRVTGWTIKKTIIKEVKQGMCDDLERDFAERLRWQHKIHDELSATLPIPKVIEIFQEKGNTYLAMEYIKGELLQDRIRRIYKDSSWTDLDNSSKAKLISYFINVLDLVKGLHEHAYVHRDLTPGNFIVSKNNKLVVIDLELAYNLTTGQPNPPFRLGTFGYISPEQLESRIPTKQEDIYAIGAMIISIFTNLSPAYFNVSDAQDLKNKLQFYLKNTQLIEITIKCLSSNPAMRPSLDSIYSVINNERTALTSKTAHATSTFSTQEDTNDYVKLTISQALTGLCSRTMVVGANRLWHSNPIGSGRMSGNRQTEQSYYPWYHTGVAGVLTTISRAKTAGLCIKNELINIYNQNYQFIMRNFMTRISELPSGLLFGTSGIAVAISDGMKAGLSKSNKNSSSLIINCINREFVDFDLATGASGIGIAAIHVIDQLGYKETTSLLRPLVSKIISHQDRDGSWCIKGEKKNGLFDGAAGIILFLLSYAETFNDSHSSKAAVRGLQYLRKQRRISHGKTYWRLSNKNSNSGVGLHDGFVGISLTFLRAYKVLKDPQYLDIATNALNNFPRKIVDNDLTLANGLSGLGSVLLEAYKITNNPDWIDRASWIAMSLCNCSYRIDENSLCWITNPNQLGTADLMNGNSGIIHFLLNFVFNDNNKPII